MRSNKSKNNCLEMAGRRKLWEAGLRGYRVNVSNLPGKPDVVFTRWKVAVFFHGCFWHGCTTCSKPPSKTNADYWIAKIGKNKERDRRSRFELQNLGYIVVEVWEHDMRDPKSPFVEQLGLTLGLRGFLRCEAREKALP